MRVTNNLLAQRAMRNLQQAMTNIEGPQKQLTTGKRITKPSDGPVDATRIINIKTTASKIDQYGKNISSTLNWINITSSSLESIVDILDEVNDLIATLGDPTTSAERLSSANQVDMLIMDLLSVANRQFMGKYLFGGNETLSQPFNAESTDGVITSVSQNPKGIDGTRVAQISDTDTVQVNTPGGKLFQPSGTGADDDIFKILTDLRTALENNDTGGMNNVQERLDTAVKSVAAENAVLGGYIRRLEDIEARAGEDSMAIEERRSRLEDADIAQAMFEYNQAEIIYQAALAATSRVIQISLVNFLK